MKKTAFSLGLLLIVFLALSIGAEGGRAARLKLDEGFGSAPLHFIANKGQTSPEALFSANASGYTLWLTRTGLLFDGAVSESKRAISRLVFKNADPKAVVRAEDPSDYRVSYFYARDEADWITDVPTSRAVVYENLYDGIDLKVYGNERRVEYDWIVRTGADPNRIRFTYEAAGTTRIDRDGDLIVETASGELRHRKPTSFQVIDGKKVEVSASFRRTVDGEYGFRLDPYNPRFDLVIDPLVLVYSTYLGGRGKDFSESIAVDKAGAIYVAGTTTSTDFPPVNVSLPRRDVFVTKLSADGKSLISSAFFPLGLSYGYPRLDVGAPGNVYLSLETSSTKFPIKNAFQTAYGGGESDGVILKMNANGKGLVYSSYIGGSGSDYCRGMAVDKEGQACISGWSNSLDFPIKKAFQKTHGGKDDAFIAKVAADGRSILFSTFLGGSQREVATGVLALDGSSAIYVAGWTSSSNFPIKNAIQSALGGKADVFITKLSPEGKNLEYSTYLGGNGDDFVLGLAVDASGAAYITGWTKGSFPVKNAFQKTRKGAGDAFISKLASDGKSLVFSTFLGGTGYEQGNSIAVDAANSVYVVGLTRSANFPTKEAYQTSLNGGQDGFLTIFDPSGSKLLTSTFLGGVYWDEAYGLTLDSNGIIYITGYTNSPDFPTAKPYQKTFKGDNDAFVLKFKRQ